MSVLLVDLSLDGLYSHQAEAIGLAFEDRDVLVATGTASGKTLCHTLDFSHSVGSANSPWHTVFVYERYPYGLGFTGKAYEQLGEILPRVHAHIRQCPCDDGCPCRVGKPLRQYTTWNVERRSERRRASDRELHRRSDRRIKGRTGHRGGKGQSEGPGRKTA